jgi:stress response protein YsnF
VTENVQETVPVKHEEARVEREPITDDKIEQAMSGPDITGSEHEVTLHTEEPVVEKRTVHKERVRLDKDVHTDERTVNEEVRHERIEGDGQAEARV